MSRLTLAAAAAALAVCAAPAAFAQDAAPAAPAAQPAPSPEEAAFQAKGEAFNAEAQRMKAELDAVIEDPALDPAAKQARADAIITRYEPTFNAFADELGAFFRTFAEKPENAENKEQILAAAEAAPAQIRAVPAQIRQAVAQAVTAPAAPDAQD
ncbi:MAG TPA: translation initiation factor IF-2 [Brevundimonas sp.]